MITTNLGHLTNDDLLGADAIGSDLAASSNADSILASLVDILDFDAMYAATRPAPIRDYELYQDRSHAF